MTNDLISRQAAIDAFWQLDIEIRPSAIDAITKMLMNLPSAQPEMKEKGVLEMKNRLSLKHLIETLRMEHEIELRDENNYRLFNCSSNSQALEPYLNRNVVEWFACAYESRKVVILIGEEK